MAWRRRMAAKAVIDEAGNRCTCDRRAYDEFPSGVGGLVGLGMSCPELITHRQVPAFTQFPNRESVEWLSCPWCNHLPRKTQSKCGVKSLVAFWRMCSPQVMPLPAEADRSEVLRDVDSILGNMALVDLPKVCTEVHTFDRAAPFTMNGLEAFRAWLLGNFYKSG